MTWKVVTFANTAGGIQRSTILQDKFGDAIVAHRAPEDAAIFARSTPDGREYECFFSPAAAAIFNPTLEKWGARDAHAPDREKLSLLVGDAVSAWKLLLPVQGRQSDHRSGAFTLSWRNLVEYAQFTLSWRPPVT